MWFDRFYSSRKILVAFFILLSTASLFLLPNLKFNFNFEQFFPKGDPDLEFFQSFVEEFESDDNFLLIAFEREPTVFDNKFLKELKAFSIDCKKKVPYVKQVYSLPLVKNPIMTPFGPTTLPVIHLEDPSLMRQDSIKVMEDNRLLYNLISADAKATVVILKMEDNIQLEASNQIMEQLNLLLAPYDQDKVHILGRAYFQTELSRLQFREILISTIISGFLISIVMVLIFKRWVSILIALGSIGIGLILFLGILSLLGRELTIMAALYPILMLIVGTSDVVHIMSKYLDELKRKVEKREAIRLTISQIGMATLLTSLTTAAGFGTLLTSKVEPIKDFGLNSALGVILAYIVVIGFTCPLLTFFNERQLVKKQTVKDFWSRQLDKAYYFSLKRSKLIYGLSLFFLVFFAFGISQVHTNYDLYTNLPKNAKISEDFLFFEKKFAGFRPLELAGVLQTEKSMYDYEVLEQISKAEDHLISLDEIQTAFSLGSVVKSLNQMMNNANPEQYVFPDEKGFKKVKPLIRRMPSLGTDVLVSRDRNKTRVSAKIKDVGAANIKKMSARVDDWLDQNIDTTIIKFKQTGTGLLLDKNSEFVKNSLFSGLLIALAIVSILMGFLFKNLKMVFLALVPNLIPLLFAASLIGYFNIALEAGISIVFAIIFGIAVDDTIHFLSKYKLAFDRFQDREKALYVTFQECGKAIIFTSIILFCGFLVLLFSSNQPSVVIGMLISVTLVSALVADLTLLPVLIRKFKI